MPYTLYGDLGSGSAIVELAMGELALPYRIHDIALAQDQQREGKYSAVNVHRKIPTLVTPAGETLTESVAILLALSERHPIPALSPAPGSSERAQMLRWLMFAATELYPVIEMKDYPHRFVPNEFALDHAGCQTLANHYRTIWMTRWLHVETAADPKGPWFLGDSFCMLDLYLAVLSRWGDMDTWRPKHLPRVESLTHAVATRPACAAIWSRHFVNDKV